MWEHKYSYACGNASTTAQFRSLGAICPFAFHSLRQGLLLAWASQERLGGVDWLMSPIIRPSLSP